MRRFVWPIFAAALLLAVGVILATMGELPETVATHFGSGGRANGFMPYDQYVVLIVALAVGVPLLIVAATTWLPRVAPGFLKLGRCPRWADPKARPAILASTATFGAVEGALVAAFIAALHVTVVLAHRSSPPRLDDALFLPILAVFVALTAAACLVHHVATRRA